MTCHSAHAAWPLGCSTCLLLLAATHGPAHCLTVVANKSAAQMLPCSRSEVKGFRAPYYVTNGALGNALEDLGFL